MADSELSLLYKGVLYPDASAGLQRLASDFQNAAQRLQPIMMTELTRHLQSTAQRVVAKNSGAWPGGTTGSSLSRRSGTGVSSLLRGVRVSSTGGGLEGSISGAFYLAIHEYGGEMRATRAQYMTIPLPEALNANGTPKRQSAREWNNTFVGKSRNGNLIVFQRRGRLIVPLYVLKKQVRIRARLGLRQAQADAMDTFINRLAKLVTEEVMQ